MTDTESTREKKLDARQVAAWRAMTLAQRLELTFQAYQFALDAVRTTEKQRRAGGAGLARHATDAGGSKAGQMKAMEQVRDYELKAFFTYMLTVL